jgi:hypothetical protein
VGRGVGGDVVVEGIALERQQHEVAPTWVLGRRDVEDEGPNVLNADSLSVEVADGGSLKRARYGGCLPWCRRWHWCWSGSRARWRCSDSEDVSELELKVDRGVSSLLGLSLGLGGGDECLKGCDSSKEIGQTGGGSRGGGGRGCHGGLLLL